jgi:hypothetical protein
MQPLAIELSLLRSLETAELRLAPGRVLTGRVIEVLANGRGTLSIAGAALEAQLPGHLRAGQEVRLQIRDVSGGRVLMSIVGHPAADPAPPPLVPLPGGGTLTARAPDDSDRTADGEARDRARRDTAGSVSLRYHAPALGDIDLAFTLDTGQLSVHVTLTPGAGLQALQEHADELRAALTAGSDRPVTVTVLPRHDPLDVYA